MAPDTEKEPTMNDLGHEMSPIPPTATPNTPLRTAIVFVAGFILGMLTLSAMAVIL